MAQVAREKALTKFREDKLQVLVATDVAARGIDVAGVTHVINYTCPEDEKTYVHRIGRTGRAGATGIAVTFVDWADLHRWKMINKALDLPFDEPQETYSTSEHLFHDLGIPPGTKGRIVDPRAASSRAPSAPRRAAAGRGRGGRRGRRPRGAPAAAAPAQRHRASRSGEPAGRRGRRDAATGSARRSPQRRRRRARADRRRRRRPARASAGGTRRRLPPARLTIRPAASSSPARPASPAARAQATTTTVGADGREVPQRDRVGRALPDAAVRLRRAELGRGLQRVRRRRSGCRGSRSRRWSPWVKRTKYCIVPESSTPTACRERE